ncbi:MAG: 16S rRNA (guanine(527)-N(7))-methyltransferase RsmG [Bacilli bacterium]
MNKEEFINELKKINIELTKQQLTLLEEYYIILKDENEKYNLTRIIEQNEVYLKHFYDSLTINKIIDIYSQNICDLGSGAGFSGLVLAICFPKTKITLIESNGKKCYFLNLVKEKLKLNNVIVINERSEDYAQKNREKFDIVTARAVAPLKHLLEYGIPLLKVNGNFIAMKANVENEEQNIENYLNKLSIQEKKRIIFNLPVENSLRTIIMYTKTKKTDKKYPRRYNEILKKEI